MLLFTSCLGKKKLVGGENIDQWVPGFKGVEVLDHRGVPWRVVELFCILIMVMVT